MRKWFLIVFLLSGCADSWDVVEEKKPQYLGQPIDSLIMRFGPPAASGEVAGEEYYTWTNSTNFIYSTPNFNTAYSSGSYNTSSGGFGSYSGTTNYTSSRTRSTQLNCTFTVRAKKRLIIDMDVNGNNGACEAYSQRL